MKSYKLDIWHIPFKNLSFNAGSLESLSQEEKTKANSFLKDKDRENYIFSHIYLRQILSHYFPLLKEEEWEFTLNAYGRPELSLKHKIRFYFNLSHSTKRAYIICSSFPLCGIDVEELTEIEYNPELLEMVLSKEEERKFMKVSNKKKLFFAYWTLKEAHLKALGRGLSLSPKEVNFQDLDEFEKELYIKDKNSFYGLLYIQEEYLMSFAVLGNQKDLEVSFFSVEDL